MSIRAAAPSAVFPVQYSGRGVFSRNRRPSFSVPIVEGHREAAIITPSLDSSDVTLAAQKVECYADAHRNHSPVAGHTLGPQTPFVSHHVWHCLGRGIVALLVGFGEGFRSGQARQLKNLGPGHYVHFPGPHSRPSRAALSPAALIISLIRITSRFAAKRRSLKYLSPVLNREDIRAVSDYGSTNGQVFGIAPEYNQIRNVPVGPGRWFNDEDNTETRRVAVVGWELLKNIFPGRPAVGSSILLNGIRFEIIGVLSKVGQDGNNGTNARIFIPIETMRNLFRLKDQNSEDAISFLNYRPFDAGAASGGEAGSP